MKTASHPPTLKFPITDPSDDGTAPLSLSNSIGSPKNTTELTSIGKIEIPWFLADRTIAAAILPSTRIEQTELHERDRASLRLFYGVLSSPQIDELIDAGKLTLGLLKPALDKGTKGLPAQDQEAAALLLREIGAENILVQFSYVMTKEDVENFYASIKKTCEAKVTPSGKTVWDSIVDYMTSGPVTVLLLQPSAGEAVTWWRKLMGKTNPLEADPSSIRGKYGLTMPDNVVHGSDSPGSVRNEIGVIGKGLLKLL